MFNIMKRFIHVNIDSVINTLYCMHAKNMCNASPSTSEQTQTDGLRKPSFVKKRIFNRLRRL